MFAQLKKIVLAAVLAVGVSPLSSTAQAAGPAVPAPEFTGIEKWLNSAPLDLASLRGKVGTGSISGPIPASTASTRCPT